LQPENVKIDVLTLVFCKADVQRIISKQLVWISFEKSGRGMLLSQAHISLP
jgi:hypothetical protein